MLVKIAIVLIIGVRMVRSEILVRATVIVVVAGVQVILVVLVIQ